ncbi:MAG: HD domain-containing protein [Actinobacteria bacterium]|nr:HD domain-containing protein [Actinomycetota bacterium]
MATERLATAVRSLVDADDVDQMCTITLRAAMDILGADAGRVILHGDGGDEIRVAVGGPLKAVVEEPIAAGGRRVGLVQLAGGNDGGRPAVRVLAAQLALKLANVETERVALRQRDRAERFAEAIREVRGDRGTEESVLSMLTHACRLTGGSGAALVTGLPGDPGPVVSVDLSDEHRQELGDLVTGELSSLISDGRPWSGPVPSEVGFREAGMAGLALVPVGDQLDRIGTLAVVTTKPGGVDADELDALAALADHAAAALGAAALRERLEDLGTVDPATRFFNARYFQTRLEQECHRALRNQDMVSLLVLGVDGLDQLRSASGEHAAVAAVAALAEFLVPRLRATDVGCRTGSDELTVILPDSTGMDAYRIAERIRSELSAEVALAHGVSMSAGVASFPDQAGTADQLAAASRTALGLARRHGGDRTFLFDREVAAMIDEEDRRSQVVEESLITTISALAVAVDERHHTTREHSQNVGRIAALIAREMELDPVRVEEVRLAGLLHDVGKIGVSDELLTREGPLEPHEWDEMRQHPEIGYRMLSGTRLRDVRWMVRHHHERWDGAGYPHGLDGERIPLESRILAVANALDSMVHDRPYRMAMSFDDAITTISDRSGSQFCPATVEALLRLVERDPAWIRPDGPGA